MADSQAFARLTKWLRNGQRGGDTGEQPEITPELCAWEEDTLGTALHVAVRLGVDASTTLQILAANPSAASSTPASVQGRTPLHNFHPHTSLDVLTALIDAHPDALTTQDAATASVSAPPGGFVSAPRGLPPSAGGETPLSAAVGRRSVPDEAIMLLLSRNPAAAGIPNAKGKYPAHKFHDGLSADTGIALLNAFPDAAAVSPSKYAGCFLLEGIHSRLPVPFLTAVLRAYPDAANDVSLNGDRALALCASSFRDAEPERQTELLAFMQELYPLNRDGMRGFNVERVTFRNNLEQDDSSGFVVRKTLPLEVKEAVFPLQCVVERSHPNPIDVNETLRLLANSPNALIDLPEILAQQPLHQAIVKNDVEEVKRLVAATPGLAAVPNRMLHRFPIHVALLSGAHADIVLALFEAFPQCCEHMDATAMSPLTLALKNEYPGEVLTRLYTQHPDALPSDPPAPLMSTLLPLHTVLGSYFINPDDVKQLVADNPAVLDGVDPNGLNALHRSVTSTFAVFSLLVELTKANGRTVDWLHTNKYGSSMLLSVAENNRLSYDPEAGQDAAAIASHLLDVAPGLASMPRQRLEGDDDPMFDTPEYPIAGLLRNLPPSHQPGVDVVVRVMDMCPKAVALAGTLEAALRGGWPPAVLHKVLDSTTEEVLKSCRSPVLTLASPSVDVSVLLRLVEMSGGDAALTDALPSLVSTLSADRLSALLTAFPSASVDASVMESAVSVDLGADDVDPAVLSLLLERFTLTDDTRFKDGNTLLHVALEAGPRASVDVVKAVLAAQPSAVKLTNGGYHRELPLAVCCRKRCSLEVTQLVLEANPEAASHTGSDGSTPLMVLLAEPRTRRFPASPDEGVDVVELILDANPDALSHTTPSGRVAIHQVGFHTSTGVMELLLAKAPDTVLTLDSNGQAALHHILQNGGYDPARVLLKHCPSAAQITDSTNRAPVHMVRGYKAERADIVDACLTAFPGAAALVAMNTAKNGMGADTLFGGNRDPRYECGGHLLAHLMFLTDDVSTDVLKRVIVAHPDAVNATNDFGWTPLHFACALLGKSRVEGGVMEHLTAVSGEAMLTTGDKDGYVPLELGLRCDSANALNSLDLLAPVMSSTPTTPSPLSDKAISDLLPERLQAAINRSQDQFVVAATTAYPSLCRRLPGGQFPFQQALGYQRDGAVVGALLGPVVDDVADDLVRLWEPRYSQEGFASAVAALPVGQLAQIVSAAAKEETLLPLFEALAERGVQFAHLTDADERSPLEVAAGRFGRNSLLYQFLKAKADAHRLVAGRYLVEKTALAKLGGRAVVDMAVDMNTNAKVAIKWFHADDAGLADSEAHMSELLGDDVHVLTLRERFDADRDGVPHTALVYSQATGSLHDLMSTRELSSLEAISVSSNLLRCIKWVNDLGIVHCDVKPGNALMFLDGSLRLADFDASVEVGTCLKGVTVWYCPPEVASHIVRALDGGAALKDAIASGLRAVPASPSMDVWAAGVTILELLNGGKWIFPGVRATDGGGGGGGCTYDPDDSDAEEEAKQGGKDDGGGNGGDGEDDDAGTPSQQEAALRRLAKLYETEDDEVPIPPAVSSTLRAAASLLKAMLAPRPRDRIGVDDCLNKRVFAGAASTTQIASTEGAALEAVEDTMEAAAEATVLASALDVKMDEALASLSDLRRQAVKMTRVLMDVGGERRACSSLFVLLPASGLKARLSPSTWFTNKYVLRLLCETCFQPSATHDGFEVTEPKAFVAKTAAYLQPVIKVAMLAAAWIGVGDAADEYGEYLESLGEVADASKGESVVGGDAWDVIQAVVKPVVGVEVVGGLHRCLDDSADETKGIVWLCPQCVSGAKKRSAAGGGGGGGGGAGAGAGAGTSAGAPPTSPAPTSPSTSTPGGVPAASPPTATGVSSEDMVLYWKPPGRFSKTGKWQRGWCKVSPTSVTVSSKPGGNAALTSFAPADVVVDIIRPGVLRLAAVTDPFSRWLGLKVDDDGRWETLFNGAGMHVVRR